MPVPDGELFQWDGQSTYVRKRPTSRICRRTRENSRKSKGRVCWRCLDDSVTTDHISPAGSIEKNGLAARYLTNNDVAQKDFNQYGVPRGATMKS